MSSLRGREALYRKFSAKILTNPDLSRSLVSFQANKTAPFYRWFKYKEAFSSRLIEFFLEKYNPNADSKSILDPFAGAGTTLTTAADCGWNATGIELLPIGVAAIRARILSEMIDPDAFLQSLKSFEDYPLDQRSNGYCFPHLRITERAFPPSNERAISSYVGFLKTVKNPNLRFLFWFACLSILEEISYTRKDGQYLRWDSRSGRNLKSTFNKGQISRFRKAILEQLHCMHQDMSGRKRNGYSSRLEIIEGSCLDVLPTLTDNTFDLVITSPPYCNRYDYTRTYALELAFYGYDEDAVKRLRQKLLSSTVENKSKREQLAEQYEKNGQKSYFMKAEKVFAGQEALQEVLHILNKNREDGTLNNNNIPQMVEGYFFELNLIIHELARALAPKGHIIMVNDNVQYNGEEVPVDLILSDFAAKAGLSVDHIWTLSRGKGNSSQQMGAYGRNEIRKGVYVWSK